MQGLKPSTLRCAAASDNQANVRLGQKRTPEHVQSMSALLPKADIAERHRHVRFVPKAGILRRIEERPTSIASPTPSLGAPVYAKLSKCGILLSICELIKPMSRPTLVGAKP